MTDLLMIDSLILDPRLQPRIRMDGDLVNEYADAMARGDLFPPIRVVGNKESKWLVDGWHRVAAARSIKRSELSAQVIFGTFEDAEDQSLTVNRDHGLRRTHVDVQNAIRRALLMPRWVERSDQWIGRHIGCRNVTVTAMREQLESASQIDYLDSLLGEDGKRYPRTRQSRKLVIADTYTIAEWESVSAKDQQRILKASAETDGKGFNAQDTDNIEWVGGRGIR